MKQKQIIYTFGPSSRMMGVFVMRSEKDFVSMRGWESVLNLLVVQRLERLFLLVRDDLFNDTEQSISASTI